MSKATQATLDRFFSHLKQDGDCWTWQRYLMPNGYGRFSMNGRYVYAHRAAILLLTEEDPSGAQVDHRCWNRACVNPDHLRVVTSGQNHQNRSPASLTGASGIRGVTWDKARNKWKVHVRANGHQHNLGRFSTLEEAREAAIRGRAQLFDNYVEHGIPVAGLAAVNVTAGNEPVADRGE